MREILHVQVGQCGNQVGHAFWEAVQNEHYLDGKGNFVPPADIEKLDQDGDGVPDQLECIDVYYRQNAAVNNKANATYTPRAILVDLEPGTLDVIKDTQLADLFDPTNMNFGNNGAGNNWAKGHYTEGAELVEQVMDCVRKEAEKSECVQGFQLFHSLGGGTGSGMGTLLLLKIRDAYPDKITCTYSVFPSPKVSDTVVEPYNAVLSSHQLLENSDETFIVDNEALYNIMHNVLKQNTVEYKILNGLIAKVTCGITASLRFPGMLNGDLRKLGVNLVPFPRLHFFLCAYAPLTAAADSTHSTLDVKELTKQASSAKNFYCNVKPDDGKFLAVSYNFRGRAATEEEAKAPPKGTISSEKVDAQMQTLQNKDSNIEFVEWIPNNIKSSIILVPPEDSKMSATVVGNSTALKGIFQRLATQFGAMYRRKAFLHWYKGEGMDEMEFQEADKNVRDLITEYQDKEDATYEEEGSEAESGGDEDDD
jgi:tubulin beta